MEEGASFSFLSMTRKRREFWIPLLTWVSMLKERPPTQYKFINTHTHTHSYATLFSTTFTLTLLPVAYLLVYDLMKVVKHFRFEISDANQLLHQLRWKCTFTRLIISCYKISFQYLKIILKNNPLNNKIKFLPYITDSLLG